MGMPISEEVQQLVADFWLKGEKMDLADFVRYGFDARFLELKFELFKPQIPYMADFEKLEDAYSYEHVKSTWAEYVAWSELTGTRCLWFNQSRVERYSQLYLNPIRGGSSPIVQVFLTRKGTWLVYTNHATTSEIARFMTYETVADLLDGLRAREGETHRFFEYGDSAAMVLARRLDMFLEDSIKDKEERLAAQRRLLEKTNAMNEHVRWRY